MSAVVDHCSLSLFTLLVRVSIIKWNVHLPLLGCWDQVNLLVILYLFVNVVICLLFCFVLLAAMFGQHNWIVVQYELCVTYRGSLTDLCGSVFVVEPGGTCTVGYGDWLQDDTRRLCFFFIFVGRLLVTVVVTSVSLFTTDKVFACLQPSWYFYIVAGHHKSLYVYGNLDS
jgi:hypothetical protein